MCGIIMSAVTHHSNREVVVDDLIGHGVSSFSGVVGYHPDAPAVHRNQLTWFNLPQNLPQVWPLVTFWSFMKKAGPKQIKLCFLCYLLVRYTHNQYFAMVFPRVLNKMHNWKTGNLQAFVSVCTLALSRYVTYVSFPGCDSLTIVQTSSDHSLQWVCVISNGALYVPLGHQLMRNSL